MAAPAFDLVIVGGGNMGGALAAGLLSAGIVAADRLAIIEALAARRDELAQLLPRVHVSATVAPGAAAVLAVKPPDVPEAAQAAAGAGARRLLSIAAGVTTGQIERAVATVTSDNVAVIRAMPNTPALVGEGASAISAGASATDSDLDWAAAILGGVGVVVRVTEDDLDAVTGLSGSGPAYLFLVAEALVAAGIEAGLRPDLASTLTTQLFVGASKLLAVRGDPAALRVMVTSPGGTTAAGLHVLEQREVGAAFVEAVQAATRRSRELSPDP